ncbi:MAG: 4Fe-4S binding protein, partial [Candidatus Brocadiaceae bacterium]
MAKRRRVWPRRIRRVVQAAAFLLVLAFIVWMPALIEGRGRGDWLMRFSPFSGLSASISAWELIAFFWPALVLFVLALVLGRYFCGWLCPLGATLDVADRALGRRRALPSVPEDGPSFEHVRGRRLKYYVLAGCLVAAFLGVSAFGLLDPLSIAVRSYVVVVHSYVVEGLVSLFGAFGLTGAAKGTRSALIAETTPLFGIHLLTLLVFLVVLGLEVVRRRFWCRYLCPLGAMYALAGTVARTKRSVSEECIECGQCVRACPTSCISPDGHRTLNGECILCLDCQAVCPTRAVSFLSSTPAEQAESVDLSRRGALTAVAAGALAYPAFRLKPAAELAKGDPLIRPPLAGKDTEAFLAKCLRCGQCMRACPTHVIQPAGLRAGLEGLWTPHLVPRLGYCVYECDACGRACPSGAIPRFTLEEKHRSAMGLAYVDRVRCIPWRGNQRRDEEGFVADDHNCGVCEEVCPVPGKAIHFRRVYGGGGQGEGRGRAAGDGRQELRLPYVREEACVGCGFCEASCPLQGEAAIRVTGGYRELPPPEEAAEAAPPTAQALPKSVAGFRLAGPVTTYTGGDELFDYINGGAEPYLTFNFIRVSTAEYTDGENTLKVDLWQFETPDDAFGAFAKDRRGESVNVGDEGSMQRASLWARRGPYVIAILDMGQSAPDGVKKLAAAALEATGAKPAPRPGICRRLPREDLDESSVIFMRDEAPLFNVTLSENWIEDGTFGITGGAVGAYGAYRLREDDKPAGVLLIEHADAEAARAAAERLAAQRDEWGDQRVAEEPYVVFGAAGDNYCVIGTKGRRFAAAFFMPSGRVGEE